MKFLLCLIIFMIKIFKIYKYKFLILCYSIYILNNIYINIILIYVYILKYMYIYFNIYVIQYIY